MTDLIIGPDGKMGLISIAYGPKMKPMPGPTSAMLNNDPLFDAIWEVIKDWDVNVPQYYAGYMGATGSHVNLIYQAIKSKLNI